MAWVIGIGIFLALLIFFPKVVIPILVLAAIGIAGFFYNDHLAQKAREQKREAVKLTVARNPAACSEKFPLLVTIRNGSDDTVNKISFSVQGFRPGHSDPIYDSGFRNYSTDKIIRQGELSYACWAIPAVSYKISEEQAAAFPPETLIWSISGAYPDFAN